jgi:hypothetical protein
MSYTTSYQSIYPQGQAGPFNHIATFHRHRDNLLPHVADLRDVKEK